MSEIICSNQTEWRGIFLRHVRCPIEADLLQLNTQDAEWCRRESESGGLFFDYDPGLSNGYGRLRRTKQFPLVDASGSLA